MNRQFPQQRNERLMEYLTSYENKLQALAYQLLFLRNRHFLLLDLISFALTPTLALLLRVERLPRVAEQLPALVSYTLLALLLRLAIFFAFGLYRRFWRYASSHELGLVLWAGFVASLATGATFLLLKTINPVFTLPRSIPVLDALLMLALVTLTRASIRLTEQWRRNRPSDQAPAKVVIVGAGHTGELVAREIQAAPQLNLTVAAFVDDDPVKQQMQIRSIPVIGGLSALSGLLQQQPIDRVIIAMPAAPGKKVREVVALCRQLGVPTQTMPGLHELLNGAVSVNRLRAVQIEDLLRRAPIHTDTYAVQELLQGKRVLVTGGGGSIGSELCRQILRCLPAQLIVVGHGENSIFEISNELARLQAEWATNARPQQPHPTAIQAEIADLRFAERVQHLFATHRPQVVFHAAAHKHVPLMELHPGEAITNNVLGTQNLLTAAQAVDVERFVMVSTDKAVNPTSVMGASKRVAELLVHQAAQQSGRAYQVVRFGNVLGSRGSVVHTFRQQIARGGPVTVTHPDMVRFFMTIPEAVQLLLQATVLGQGGEVFMLDMGEPVKVVDLARDLIALSGLEVDRDIEIVFSGIRPGEKLYEEMFTDRERYRRTEHAKVLVATNAGHFVPACLERTLTTLLAAAWANDSPAVRLGLQELVPEYQPTPSLESSTGRPANKADKPPVKAPDEEPRALLPFPALPALEPSLGH